MARTQKKLRRSKILEQRKQEELQSEVEDKGELQKK